MTHMIEQVDENGVVVMRAYVSNLRCCPKNIPEGHSIRTERNVSPPERKRGNVEDRMKRLEAEILRLKNGNK